jgi:hypothetical protein
MISLGVKEELRSEEDERWIFIFQAEFIILSRCFFAFLECGFAISILIRQNHEIMVILFQFLISYSSSKYATTCLSNRA